MAEVIKTIIDTIQLQLETIGVMSGRSGSWSNQLYFATAGNPYTISCNQHGATIHDGQSLCGEYLYADPDFYTRLVKRVRMLVNPTSIWHICQAGPSIGMPCILDE